MTLADATNPTAVCQNITVNLDGSGNASITGAQVDGGSTDNCGIASRLVTPNTFTTANIGANTVTLTVTDNNARTGTCTAIVTVTNTNLPNAVCQPYTAVLNSGGTVSITAANVDGGSTAVGGIASLGVSPNSFTCSNLGTNTVVLTVTGNNGQSSTCNATVTVQDNTSPTAVCQNIAVNLSGSTANITAAQILNIASSSDNCGTVNASSVLPNSFNCTNLGANTVTLTANDGHGNTATCTAVVTVSDATAPTALCQNISVNLNAIGTVSVGAAQVNNASTDNCGSVNLVSVVPNTFTCVNLGQNTVTLTVNDGHGNTATCLATVSVADNLAPSALCRDIVAQLDGNGNATITAAQVNNGSSDNCALGTLTVSPSAFTLANLGINTVTLTVSDANSNSATCTAVVTVDNNQLPNAVCQNIARSLGSNGTVVLTADEVDGGSTALGGIASRSVLPNTLNCSNLGASTVVLTIVGNNGQQASCNATVTVSDNLAPTIVCQNIAVNLSGSTANITAAQILNIASSSDNCGTVNASSVSPNSFNCTNLGANTVTLTANDGHGNTATCTAVVTVSDATAPTPVCQNIAVNLSGTTANITAAQILNIASSSDNCGTVNASSVLPNSFNCTNLGANTVTLTANDGHGNTASCTAIVTVNDATGPTVVCQNIAVNLSGSTANITAAQILNVASSSDNCGTVNASSVLPNSFNCTNLGANTVTLTANDGHGNTASCTAVVTVSDVTAPIVVCQNIAVNLGGSTANITAAQILNVASSSDNCGTVTASSVSPNSFNCTNLGANTVTLTANDGHGNTATCTAVVTVSDATAPVALCQNISVNLNAIGTASVGAAQVNNASTDNCGSINLVSVVPNTFTCVNLGQNTVTLTVNDGHGNTATCLAIVSVADNLAPSALCRDIMAQLDGSGNATITAAQVNNGSSDNCALGILTVSPSTFTLANLGINTVTLTVSDANSNSATCTAVVTVDNNQLPNAVCQNIARSLGSNGTVVLTAAEVDGGSTALGGIAMRSVSPNTLNCSNLGAATVVLTIVGNNGQQASCNATVTVSDNLAPTAVCQNIAVNLSGSTASITAAQILNVASSSDNCGMVNASSVSPNTFNCTNLGANIVTLTANDGHGNSATCTAIVTVSDANTPTVVCQNIAVNLSGSTANITAAQILNVASSSDNCGTVNASSVLPNAFNCTNLGANTVTLTANDGHGNSATCTAIVTVSDNTAPIPVCQNIAVNLSGSTANITAAQILNAASSSDNCGTVNASSVSPNAFNCTNLGANTVTLTANDGHGNSATCTAIVTVSDNTAPTAVCQNIAVNLSGSTANITAAQILNVVSSSDNCGTVNASSVLPNSFNCTNLGANTVTLTANDGHGNTASCTAVVTVSDVTAPIVVCQNIAVNLGGSTANITAAQILNVASSSDNCGTVTASSVSPNSFNCTNLGANTVTLTANDGHGNTATCTAVVTVSDATAPVALCQNISVNLNAIGTASVGAAQVNNASTDNCGSINLVSVVPNTFTCVNLGQNTVTLTVNDGHGNTATCLAIVSVADNLAPSALCRDIMAQLDGSGNATITAAQVNNGSSDNCALGILTVSPSTFTLANLGINTVTLTVSDANSNSATCTAVVTVDNNQLPNAVCQNIARSLGSNGTVVLTAAEVDGGSTALGGIAMRSVSPNTLNCSNLGAATVVLTIVGNNGQQTSCNATVTVSDNLSPSAVCQNIAVNLSGSTASITAAQILNVASSSDNCGMVNASSVSPNTFNCTNLGANIVTLTANDGHGNSATCTAIVTVSDANTPTVVCQNIAVNLSGSTANITAAQILNVASSSDNCGTVNASSVLPNAFNCTNLGANTVTLTANDGHGNSATCTAIVTVSDNTAPIPVCQNIAVNLSGSTANITAAQILNAASSSDNCGTVNASSVSPNAFNCTNLGANTVTLTANDGHGNSATCTAIVTVSDNTAPTAVCQNIAVNLSGSTANIPAAQILNVVSSSDNCGTVNASIVSPNTFNCTNLGANTVTLTANDGHGNSATCTAIVTVSDNTAPTAVCQNIAVNLSGSAASITAVQILNVASSSDNCGTVNAASVSPNSFNCTNLGANTVTLTANDGRGNTATCTAIVTVQAAEINLRGNGMDILDGDATPGTADHTDFGQTTGSPIVRTFTVQNTGAVALPVSGITIGGTNPGQFSVGPLTPASPVAANGSATFTVTYAPNAAAVHNATINIANGDCDEAIYDFAVRGELTCTAPTFTACPSTPLTAPATNGLCSATLAYSVIATGIPSPALTYAFTGATTGTGGGTGTGASFNTGITTVIVTATNPCGMPTCTFTVTVSDTQKPTITCPGNMSKNTDANQCTAVANYTSPSFSDNCAGAFISRTSGLASGSAFPIGTTMVEWKATDVGGNSSTCSFIVNVLDAQAPNITCPANIVRGTDLGQCNALVTYATPTATDNCTTAIVAIVTSSLNSGSVFSKGVSTVVWKATDTAGNTQTCAFTVTVNDAQKPTITCPANKTQSTSANLCSALVSYTTPTVTDNCTPNATVVHVSGGTGTIQGVPNSSATFGKGMNTVIWKATDAAGNTQTCSFRVTVNDTEAPTMTCPAAISLSTATNTCSAVATYTNPSFTDNCTPTAGTSTRISGLVSGSTFPVGNSNVVFQATDAAGNTRRCTMVVTVTDNQPPVITCPAPVVVIGSGTPCKAVVFYGSTTASDNCAGMLTPFLFTGLSSGSQFPAGVTTNTFRAVAPNGQSSECSFTVTVDCGSVMGHIGVEVRDKDLSIQHSDKLDLKVAPNPALSTVTVSIEGVGTGGGTLLVFDAVGRLVLRQVIEENQRTAVFQVEDSEFAPGLYRVNLRTERGMVTKTLVVVKE